MSKTVFRVPVSPRGAEAATDPLYHLIRAALATPGAGARAAGEPGLDLHRIARIFGAVVSDIIAAAPPRDQIAVAQAITDELGAVIADGLSRQLETTQ